MMHPPSLLVRGSGFVALRATRAILGATSRVVPVQERSKGVKAAPTAEGLSWRLVMGLRTLSAGVAIASLLLLEAWPAPAQQPLKTAVDGTFAPHAMPKLSGGIEGFNVDLANEIGRRLKRPVEIAATQFSGILPSLQAGTIDFVAAPVTVTKERAEHSLFTAGYPHTPYPILTKNGETAPTHIKQ